MKANSAGQRCSFYITPLLKIIFVASCCILHIQIVSSFTPSLSRYHTSSPKVSVPSGSRSTIQFHATTIDSPSGSMSDFQRRMKNLVQINQKTKPLSKNMPSNMQTVETLEEYKKVICSNKDGKLIVVRFYAPWCKVSKKMSLDHCFAFII
jgi:thiol:disulfide interchange protein